MADGLMLADPSIPMRCVGGDEVYEKNTADALEAELKPLVGGPIVAKMFKYDTDPAHNPQPPR
jgi:hypothetical protein